MAQIGGITNLDFCSEKPHHLAVTASTRVCMCLIVLKCDCFDGQGNGQLSQLLHAQVIVYDSLMNINRTFSRFKDKAYSGKFRADGKLLAAGGENGLVQVT